MHELTPVPQKLLQAVHVQQQYILRSEVREQQQVMAVRMECNIRDLWVCSWGCTAVAKSAPVMRAPSPVHLV
jgi:hypothetical protein